ncbi:hypothetical protein SO802_005528 [Lithocarpus litseifolius]|uniref:Transposase (putative) gypsy type domain-containing protein n=1 Tax=Lithocarpus litseifolius TaxID=425828 RepID=A0AAW2DMN0_9ROSI
MRLGATGGRSHQISLCGRGSQAPSTLSSMGNGGDFGSYRIGSYHKSHIAWEAPPKRCGTRGNSPRVLADLVLLLRQSVDWFEDLVECSLDVETLSRFSNRFQFLERVRVRHAHKHERAYHFSLEEVCFYEAAFLCGLRFPVHPFIMGLSGHFNIAPRQRMPNSWRIVISCMEIWMASTEGDMIMVNEFTYLYRLKESKEYRYYEPVPWVREATIIRGLPSSFQYSKSWFFFASGDEWDSPSDEVWGHIPRLLHWWRATSLGASSLYQSFVLHSFACILSSLTLLFVVSCAIKKRSKLKS